MYNCTCTYLFKIVEQFCNFLLRVLASSKYFNVEYICNLTTKT